MSQKLRPIAMYLPQFHPIPENDAWWGKGFTEWTNVTKARPLFDGHYQPHLPADLGFYDLRVPEVREMQAQMARDHGIHGFCYYHYWFNGRRILEKPFESVFRSGSPDFPFMLCWANENWTRVWDGSDKHVLLNQQYSEDDDRQHIRSLIPYFNDPRYIRIDNKPVFAVYKSTLLPDPAQTVRTWREEAAKEGLELYIVRFDNFGDTGETYVREGGFDGAVDFQPFSSDMQEFRKEKASRKKPLISRAKSKLARTLLKATNKDKYENLIQLLNHSVDYGEYVEFVTRQPFPGYKRFPGITPMWDNTARRKKNYFLFSNPSPELYGRWLKHIKNSFKPASKDENLIFINAWNEWAEGNHLEPDARWGDAYLQETKKALAD